MVLASLPVLSFDGADGGSDDVDGIVSEVDGMVMMKLL